MNNNSGSQDLGEKLEQGILLARKRMLREKSLRGQDIILGDGKGGIIRMPAKDFIAANKDYQ